MVSKRVVIFICLGQAFQWAIFYYWLVLKTEEASSCTRSGESSDKLQIASATFLMGVSASENTKSEKSVSAIINTVDIDQYLRFANVQAKERYRLNEMAPTNADLFYSYLLQVWCPGRVRVGGLEDGGKWMCNPWHFLNRNMSCVVYSIGVGFNTKFDRAMIEQYACTVHAFDPDPTAQYTVKKSGLEKLFFQPWAIVGRTVVAPAQHRIQDVINGLRHTHIDVLKVDVEGGEFEIFDAFLESRKPFVPTCQVLIEVHTWDVTKWRRLFRSLEQANFLLFSREVNILGFGNKLEKIAVEYSYIHRECLERFGLKKAPAFGNFPPDDFAFDPITSAQLP